MSEKDKSSQVTITTLNDQIKDKIKNAFVEMIPDEQWKQIVQREINSFLQPKQSTSYSNVSEQVSDLQKIIQSELRSRFNQSIKDELNKSEYQGYWNNSDQQASTAVKEIIKQLAPELVQQLWGGVVQKAVEVIKNQLNSNAPY